MANNNVTAGGANKFVRESNSELNIESIISAPLIAASKANVQMVSGQTRFLLDYCFSKKVTKLDTIDPKTGKNITNTKYEPILIEMVMYRSVVIAESGTVGTDNYVPEHIENNALSFTVPMLCIIPISSLVIDKVTLDFDLDITSTTSYNDSGVNAKKAQLNGRISKQSANDNKNGQYKNQTTSRLKVNINAGTLPLPIGILSILDLYNKAIQPTPIEKK